MNLATRDILPAGVYLAPSIAVGGSKTIVISPPWVIRSAEGMTIREDQAPHTVSFTSSADGVYYVGVSAHYIMGGPAQVSIQQVDQVTYNTSWSAAQKSAFIILCEVGVTGATLTVYQVGRQTQPRGTFALEVDLLDVQGKSTITRVSNLAGLADLASPITPVNRLVYVESNHTLAIYNGTTFDRIMPQVAGSSAFVDAPVAGPNPGVSIMLPADFPNTGPSSYSVIVTSTANTNAHLGEVWVEKGVNGNTSNSNYFTVKCSGTPNLLGGVPATFDYIVLPR
jgi:hypothetical protein